MFVCTRFVRPAAFRACRAFADLPKDNPFLVKYAEKLEKLKAAAPNEYEMWLSNLRQKKTAAMEKKMVPSPSYIRPAKPLNEETLVSLRDLKSEEEIERAWKEMHVGTDSICAVIPGPVYERMEERGREFPTFVFPVPRGAGYEFLLSQVQGSQCHMTTLNAYKQHGSEAPACLKILHRTDLLNERGCVLMHGEYDRDILGPAEAQCLANQLQLYYGGKELRKKILLWNFNYEPRSFRHEDLVRELERSLTAAVA